MAGPPELQFDCGCRGVLVKASARTTAAVEVVIRGWENIDL